MPARENDPCVPLLDQPGADEILTTKWVVPILRALRAEPARFSRIKEKVDGVSAPILASRLRYLENVGIVRRMNLPRPANCQVYQLTDRGEEAIPVLDAMAKWTKTLLLSRSQGGDTT